MNLRVLLSLLVALVLGGPLSASTSLEVARQLNEAFVGVAERVSPSVVVITVSHKPEAFEINENSDGETPSREYWRKFHQQFDDVPEKITGQGSGMIIRKDGFILTNRHVIEDAEQIKVRLQDGRTFKAELHGVDRESDLAVIKIEAKGLRAVRMADSDKVRVGEFAIAIGAPFNLDYSVTFGHVSAKSRANVVPTYFGSGMMDQDFIQTDANINPGNSGGPLLNIEGAVIGINTLITGLRSGIGFAVPSNLARDVSDQIVATGKFIRPWLGVSIHGVKEDPRYEELAKLVDDGVVIDAILTNGPAASSELRRGDIITRIDGRRIGSAQDLRNEIRRKKIGQPVKLKVFRDDKLLTLHVAPSPYIEPEPTFAAVPLQGMSIPNLGMRINRFNAQLGEKYHLPQTNGVVVISVEEESPADKHNLKPGDLITSVNDRQVFSPSQFREALQAAKDGFNLHILSNGQSRTETIKTDK